MIYWVGTPTNGGGGKGLGVYEEDISLVVPETTTESNEAKLDGHRGHLTDA